jgi:hypothetical protein
VDDDDDLEDALKHLIFDLLITSTFKIEVQKQMFEAVQNRCRTGSLSSLQSSAAKRGAESQVNLGVGAKKRRK